MFDRIRDRINSGDNFQSGITMSTEVSITEKGRDRAENYDSSGLAGDILAKAHEQSPRSIGSIAGELGRYEFQDVKEMAKRLIGQGYLQLSHAQS